MQLGGKVSVNIQCYIKSKQRQKGVAAVVQTRHQGPWGLRLCRIVYKYLFSPTEEYWNILRFYTSVLV